MPPGPRTGPLKESRSTTRKGGLSRSETLPFIFARELNPDGHAVLDRERKKAPRGRQQPWGRDSDGLAAHRGFAGLGGGSAARAGGGGVGRQNGRSKVKGKVGSAGKRSPGGPAGSSPAVRTPDGTLCRPLANGTLYRPLAACRPPPLPPPPPPPPPNAAAAIQLMCVCRCQGNRKRIGRPLGVKNGEGKGKVAQARNAAKRAAGEASGGAAAGGAARGQKRKKVVEEDPEPAKKYAVGGKLDCADQDGYWYEATVLAIDGVRKIQVHFSGWDQ